MATSLEDFARGLPDGAFWVTGEFFKEFCDVLVADRARADGTTISELPSAKGRFFVAAAGGGTATPPLEPLTILDASGADSSGNTHPGRVRVVAGFLGNLLPDEMKTPDTVLPDGTDNQCYLTLAQGFNYFYGKVAVDGATSLFSSADVYTATSEEDPDGDYAYRLFGTAQFDGTTITNINQIEVGDQSLVVSFPPDGSLVIPTWI